MNSIGERKAPRQTQREQLQQDLKILRTTPGVCWPTLFCLDLSVLANTTVAEASQELVIQALVPLRTHESPSSRAVVEAAPASLPLPATNTELGTHPPRPRASILAPWLPGTKYLRLGLQRWDLVPNLQRLIHKDTGIRTGMGCGTSSSQTFLTLHRWPPGMSRQLQLIPASHREAYFNGSRLQDNRPQACLSLWGHLASLCHPDPEVRRPRTPH